MKTIPMQNNHDSLLGFMCGLFGGCIRFLQLPFEGPFAEKLVEAGITALVCGFLGVAGKHFYKYLFTHIKRKK